MSVLVFCWVTPVSTEISHIDSYWCLGIGINLLHNYAENHKVLVIFDAPVLVVCILGILVCILFVATQLEIIQPEVL